MAFCVTSAARTRGRAPSLLVMTLGSLALLAILSFLLFGLSQSEAPSTESAHSQGRIKLDVFCAAGLRYPMEQIAKDYEDEFGVSIQLTYGGSNSLLSQLQINPSGDLYLAADVSYIELAREKNLAEEAVPIAAMTPIIAVAKGNPHNIQSVEDLIHQKLRVALANPDAAAIGKKTRQLLTAVGSWEGLEALVRRNGVFKPTVNEVANDVKLGSVDAGIVWDSTVAQYPDLEAINVDALDAGRSEVQVCVLKTSQFPKEALRFARYIGARDKGLRVFSEYHFKVVQGDVWEEVPQLTLFAGSVNRRALEPILREFAEREGVKLNTVYNGCGILTAQMRTLKESQSGGFPDAYMACDVYYLDTVRDWFDNAVNVTNTPIVIVVQKGNPKQIKSLKDLTRDGVRVALGQPEQCTIGVLSKRVLEDAGVYEQIVANNLVTETATSALLIPNVATGAADAVLAYETDTLSEADRLEVVQIDSQFARAVQPYSIARNSEHRRLSQRLYRKIAESREVFEAAGFQWRAPVDPVTDMP